MTAASTEAEPAYTEALLRHFADLRDGTHGGASSRTDKERLFTEAVGLLDPYARQVLDEINRYLLLDTGEVSATGIRRKPWCCSRKTGRRWQRCPPCVPWHRPSSRTSSSSSGETFASFRP